jgi:hypothetical protein
MAVLVLWCPCFRVVVVVVVFFPFSLTPFRCCLS